MAKTEKSWMTPFKKQCFVTLGISLNMASHGFTMGFPAMLLPQLREPGSVIHIDASASSWIASIPNLFQVLGNLVMPSVMGRFGRRKANLLSICIMAATWFTVSAAQSLTTLLICRAIQGFSMGMSGTLGPVLIGEYTSPSNRGAFLSTISLASGVGVLTIHSLGSYLSWQRCAFVIANVIFVNLLIVLYSPESPVWLAGQGKYTKCSKIFKWLRGDEENEDLKRMIDGSIMVKHEKASREVSETFVKKMISNFVYLGYAFGKKEFYKPFFIMIHVYCIAVWCGVILLTSFLVDLIDCVIDPGFNVPLVAITLGVQRLVTNVLAIYLIKKFKRRTLLFTMCGLNTLVLFCTAIYTYAKSYDMLFFDHPCIGIILLHLHMFSASTGAIPFPFIIAGEIFPLEFKNLASGLSSVFFSSTIFIMVKTVPFCLDNLGIQGTYLIYGAILTYSLIISFIYLPETKDKTLEEIEDEFRGKKILPEEFKSVQSLTSSKKHDTEKRCSSPLI